MNKTDKCFCGHKRKDHTTYINNSRNSKGSKYCCTVDGCCEWNYCDLSDKKEILMEKIKLIKGFINRNLYPLRFWGRRLTEFEPICDICDKRVGFADYGYMCKTHGELIYKTNLKVLPKFLLRFLLKGDNHVV